MKKKILAFTMVFILATSTVGVVSATLPGNENSDAGIEFTSGIDDGIFCGLHPVPGTGSPGADWQLTSKEIDFGTHDLATILGLPQTTMHRFASDATVVNTALRSADLKIVALGSQFEGAGTTPTWSIGVSVAAFTGANTLSGFELRLRQNSALSPTTPAPLAGGTMAYNTALMGSSHIAVGASAMRVLNGNQGIFGVGFNMDLDVQPSQISSAGASTAVLTWEFMSGSPIFS
jgi:hypothetical protein